MNRRAWPASQRTRSNLDSSAEAAALEAAPATQRSLRFKSPPKFLWTCLSRHEHSQITPRPSLRLRRARARLTQGSAVEVEFALRNDEFSRRSNVGAKFPALNQSVNAERLKAESLGRFKNRASSLRGCSLSVHGTKLKPVQPPTCPQLRTKVLFVRKYSWNWMQIPSVPLKRQILGLAGEVKVESRGRRGELP